MEPKDNYNDLDYEGAMALIEQDRKNRYKEKIQQDETDRKRPDHKHPKRSRSRSKDNRRDREHRDNRDNRGDRGGRGDRGDRGDKHKSDRDRRDNKPREKRRSRSRDRSYEKDQRRTSPKRKRSNTPPNDHTLALYKDKPREDTTKNVERTIEEAKRQAIEAQRDDCTILLYRLHLKANEKDIFKFFAKSNIGRVRDIKIIRDTRTGASKGVAYIEFESQESVLLAVALSGQQILGQSVVIQASQAEKNRAAAAAKYKKELFKEQHMSLLPDLVEVDKPMRIYVGGLTENLAEISENDLRRLFPFGEIDYIDLNKDPITGKCKGYAFIQFRKSSQAKIAIKEMNGFNYNGKILRVGEAAESTKANDAPFLMPR